MKVDVQRPAGDLSTTEGGLRNKQRSNVISRRVSTVRPRATSKRRPGIRNPTPSAHRMTHAAHCDFIDGGASRSLQFSVSRQPACRCSIIDSIRTKRRQIESAVDATGRTRRRLTFFLTRTERAKNISALKSRVCVAGNDKSCFRGAVPRRLSQNPRNRSLEVAHCLRGFAQRQFNLLW